jgi:DNA-binding beta-propeller fold protein YncE
MPDVGTQLGGYRIDRVLGRGGMGVVYLATELALERRVALKLIAPELAGDSSFRAGFLRESRLAASIDHPNILPVYAAGEVDGELYLATRFVDGTDMRALLASGSLVHERALTFVGQVADALDAAHARGLVHRDVKPGNVLVDAADHCYLSDFGLTTQHKPGQAPASGQLVGSLDYLAPEQIRDGDVDGRSDQYALACVLYELLCAVPPFRRETEAKTLWAHMQEEAPPVPGYPELEPVFRRGLAKEQEERYPTCNAFVDDARAALGLAPSPVAVRRRRLLVGRRLLAIGGAFVAAATAAAVLAVTLDSNGTLVAPANSVALVDSASRELVQAIPVGNAPTDVAVSDEWIWVLNSNDGAGTISRIDAKTRTRASTFSIPGTPRTLLSAFGSLWVGTIEGRVFRIQPESDLVTHSWTLPNAGEQAIFDVDPGAGWLAASPEAVWAASVRAISRIDPVTSRLRHRESSAWGPLAYGFGSLWIIGRELQRVSTANLRRVATIPLAGSVDVTTGLGAVWLTSDERGLVARVDPRRNAVAQEYAVGGRPFGVATGAGAVWAATDDGRVVRIDVQRRRVSRIEVGGAPRLLDVRGREVWISVD